MSIKKKELFDTICMQLALHVSSLPSFFISPSRDVANLCLFPICKSNEFS